MFIALAALAVLSSVLTLWQWLAARRFPLHQRAGNTGFAPGVTLLKPLKGADAKTVRCLESWLNQDYPGEIQALFGVASPDDPACELVRKMIRDFDAAGAGRKGREARLVICPEALGINAKVSILIQLSRLADHEVVIVSDADVLAPPDLLANLCAPLQDESIGLANCFYRLAEPVTAAMRWEAVAVNADFWSQVLQSRSMAPLDFALGAVMATRRMRLQQIGGFEVLADYLADDFQLGNRIARAGGKIALCPVVVDCQSPPMGWAAVWAHQLRWSRTIRVSKPLAYAFSILNNATLWPLLWLAVEPGKWSLAGFAVCLLIRIATAQNLQTRLNRSSGHQPYWWLVPVKDLLQFALWALAFFGNHIVWRGQRYRLARDGRLSKN